MIVLVQANVLTVGLNGRNESLRELPIRLIPMQSGAEAIRWLRNEKTDSVVAKWDLADMKDGAFLKRLRAAKPNIPAIAFVKPNDPAQEIQARSLGARAVLSDTAGDELFRQTVANILGLKDLASVKAVCPVKSK